MASATAATARRSHWVGNQRKWPHETGGSAPGERAEAGRPRTHRDTLTHTHTFSAGRARTHTCTSTLSTASGGRNSTGPSQDPLAKPTSPPAKRAVASHIALDHVSFKFSCSPNPCNSEAGDISLGSKGIQEGQWKRRGVPYAV